MENLQFVPPQQLSRAVELYRSGRIWLTAQEASSLLSCDQSSLTNAANKKGTLGSLQYYWAGSFLKISTMSVIRFIAGEYPPQHIFGTGIPEKGDHE